MDREIWMVLECAARIVARRLPKPQRRCRFSDRQIILMWLWAALHDRPLCWACRRENCRGLFRPRSLPSVSQFCKRLAAPRFELARRRLHELLSMRGREDLLNFIDGKPLVIQGYSTDPDPRGPATASPAANTPSVTSCTRERPAAASSRNTPCFRCTRASPTPRDRCRSD